MLQMEAVMCGVLPQRFSAPSSTILYQTASYIAAKTTMNGFLLFRFRSVRICVCVSYANPSSLRQSTFLNKTENVAPLIQYKFSKRCKIRYTLYNPAGTTYLQQNLLLVYFLEIIKSSLKTVFTIYIGSFPRCNLNGKQKGSLTSGFSISTGSFVWKISYH